MSLYICFSCSSFFPVTRLCRICAVCDGGVSPDSLLCRKVKAANGASEDRRIMTESNVSYADLFVGLFGTKSRKRWLFFFFLN